MSNLKERKKNGIVALGPIILSDNCYKVRVLLPEPAGFPTQHPIETCYVPGVYGDYQQPFVLLDEPKHELVTSVSPKCSTNQVVPYAVIYHDHILKFIPRQVSAGMAQKNMDELTENQM